MTANTKPIYSKVPRNEWGANLITAANDFTGFSNQYAEVFGGDDEGGFLRALRCKAAGTNTSASVLRVFLNNGLSNQQIIAAPGTPTGTPSASGGSMATGTDNRAKIVAIGEGGDVGVASTESLAVSTTGPSASVLWGWAAPAGFKVVAYRVHVAVATNAQAEFFWAPQSTVVASQSGTTMTVTSVSSAPNVKICEALQVGTVFASGILAGTYIVEQLTSTETDGSLGRKGTYTLSASATVGSTSCVTDALKYQQLIPVHATSTGISHDGGPTKNNNSFIGEIALPATTANASGVTAPDIIYPLNIGIDPGHEVYVGLGTTVQAGWLITAIGGGY